MSNKTEGTNNVIIETQAPEHYLEAFEDFNLRPAKQPGWLKSLQQEAFDLFAGTGFPTTHDEDWRFTNVSSIAQTNFALGGDAAISEKDLESFQTSAFACRLVFVNGRFAQKLSRIPALPN